MTTAPAHKRFVRSVGERTFTIAQREDSSYVLEDSAEGYLGLVNGDFTPFLTLVDASVHVVVAGIADGVGHHVDVEFPDQTQVCRIGNGVWLTMPERWTPGMSVTVVWRDENDRELQRVSSEPLHALQPVFGPSWTGYAPM